MENFKEIAEKCLAGELSGTFVTAFDNNWHSSYLQRYTIPGHEMPEQYVLGPGIIYNDIGQCTSNEKVKIVDFIPDTMKNFKEIAEKCLAGELSGVFIFNTGTKLHSQYLKKSGSKNYFYLREFFIDKEGQVVTTGIEGRKIIDFIPDDMAQKKIEIDIPEGKVPVMEQTENGVVITWKEKELTYDGIINEIAGSPKHIIGFSYNVINDTTSSTPFYRKVDVLRKLINIRNYFGKPIDNKGYGIFYHEYYKRFYVDVIGPFNNSNVCFSTKEHAKQAIKILGDELKYLFEPW